MHTGRRIRRSQASAVLALALAAGLVAAPAAVADAPVATPCHAEITALATCYSGQDHNSAFYTIAVPHAWNGSLVMHAHGGPDLTERSDPERSKDDLARWTVMVREGYAWAGSAYRRGGYGTRMAAADTENLRRLFVATFGQPRLTFVHGQSWGGDVAAKIAEIYATGPAHPYDGVLLTSGVLAGGSRGYDYRVDLRVVYQFYCRNLPRPDEPQYPLWLGLPKNSTLTTAELRRRLQECTGYQSTPDNRTADQQRNLTDILAVTRIPERTLESHLRFAVFTFRDIVTNRLAGRNPFTNQNVHYTGSHDDHALNTGVDRFTADPSAIRDLSFDSDITGAITIPVLTMHAIDDPTAFIEHESAYRASLEGAHTANLLVQTFTQEHDHSTLSTAEYANAVAALTTWVHTGHKPTPETLATSCPTFDARYHTGCFYDPTFIPADYASRIYPRHGSQHWPALTASTERALRHLPGVGIAP